MLKTARKLLAQATHDPFGECVVWTGAQNQQGYGYVRVAAGELPELPRMARVHRVAYWIFRGRFDLDLTVDHTCHNRLCINPYHLQAVTFEENALEANHYRWHGEMIDEMDYDYSI